MPDRRPPPTTTRRAGRRSPATAALVRLATAPVTRLAAMALLLGGAATVALFADDPSITGLRAVVDDAGALAPLLFALVYAVAVAAVLPASPFTVAAGILFGPVLGVATALAGAVGGAVLGFGVGRAVGRGAVEEVTGDRLVALDAFLAERGFVSVVVVRLIPVFPLNVVNVACGVTGLRLRDYTVATAVGIVPATVALATVGGTLDRPTSPIFLAALTLLAVVTITGSAAVRRLRRRGDLPAS